MGMYQITICPECLRQQTFEFKHECNWCSNLLGKKVKCQIIDVEPSISLDAKPQIKQAISQFDNMQSLWEYEKVKLDRQVCDNQDVLQVIANIFLFHPFKSDIGKELLFEYFDKDVKEAIMSFKTQIESEDIDVIDHVLEEFTSLLKSYILNQILFQYKKEKEFEPTTFRKDLKERFTTLTKEFVQQNRIECHPYR